MKTVDINLGARAYQVRIGRGLLSCADEILPWVSGRQACIVTDKTVAKRYLAPLRAALAGKQVTECVLPGGEPGKTLDGVSRIFEALLRAQCEREVSVVALGGGVVGDMAGFAAACYQRGAPFIQAPTTLLSQVDSSVGGKTGVNHALGKNMIGAFHQPRRVLADTATLDTLDRRQFAAGMAEVIKYGAINDAEFFLWLEEHIGEVMARAPDELEFVIERSCANKARVIERDEREHESGGGRALLNFGHTFAHAIEAGAGYGNWLHGEAVATGMLMAARMSADLGWLPADECARLERLLRAAGLPAAPFAGVDADDMLRLMRGDKKVRDGKLRLVLLRGIGAAEVAAEYSGDALRGVVAHFTAGKNPPPRSQPGNFARAKPG
ncbi:MAG: 3-dehydroquinate synthase [Gammaproteobacteria bacterium]